MKYILIFSLFLIYILTFRAQPVMAIACNTSSDCSSLCSGAGCVFCAGDVCYGPVSTGACMSGDYVCPAPTNTPVPAATSTPTTAPTATSVPPTNTPVPPTSTPVPPTSTPVPPTNTPTPRPTTPTPTPLPCSVTTSPATYDLVAGGTTGLITATVTSGLGSATVSQMRFGSYNTSIATVNPTSDTTSSYMTLVSGVASGTTAVWATADLSDGRTCQSSGTTDTDINVSAPPTPTPSSAGPYPSACVVNPCRDLLYFTEVCTVASAECVANPSCVKRTGNDCCINIGYDVCENYWQSSSTCSQFGVERVPNYNHMRCINIPTSTPTPTQTPCQAAGGSCIAFAPCAPGYVSSDLSCGGSGVCCQTISTPTPTPTPNPCPYNTCESCLANNADPSYCNWGRLSESDTSACYSSTATSCPVGFSQWKWEDCNTDQCVVPPTPTTNPCPGPGPCITNTPTPTPPPGVTNTPTPTPIPCSVETSPSVHNMVIGQSRTVSVPVANITGLGSATITRIRFGSYNTSLATVSPASDTSSAYETTVTAVSAGLTAVWGTADLSDGRTCESAGDKDTDINIVAPTSTPTTPPTPTSSPTPTPIPLYSISGKIFNDTDGNERSPGNTNYTGSITITRSPASGSYNSPLGTGNYSLRDLPAGQYTVTFSGLPQGYGFTYPPPVPVDRSLIVTVGASCSPAGNESRCSGGNIINLNAGVTNLAPSWFQSIGADLRWDSGFNNPLPSSDKYSSVPGTGGMPGIIFSGASTPTFGEGSASESNWKVGGPSSDAREVFTDTHSLIPTSYRFLLETADGSGITKKGTRDLCSGGLDPTNCALTVNLANGVYKIDGNLSLNGTTYAFPTGKNFVILVNGNININEKIVVPVGSTAIFSASGNITVNQNIGETSPSSTAPNLEGLYSADVNFVADGINNCASATDKRLNIAGSVIANAGRTGGTFVNKRNLCTSNSANPSVTFIERPDFILNYPSFVTQTTRTWQDVAP